MILCFCFMLSCVVVVDAAAAGTARVDCCKSSSFTLFTLLLLLALPVLCLSRSHNQAPALDVKLPRTYGDSTNLPQRFRGSTAMPELVVDRCPHPPAK